MCRPALQIPIAFQKKECSEGGIKCFAHNEVKTCVMLWCFISTSNEAIAGSLNPCPKDWTLAIFCLDSSQIHLKSVVRTLMILQVWNLRTCLILGTVQLFISFMLRVNNFDSLCVQYNRHLWIAYISEGDVTYFGLCFYFWYYFYF